MTDSSFPETADIESASADYATRFAGEAGAWMLEVQTRELQASLQGLNSGGSALDVGGGHGQTEPVLREAGFTTLVTGSDPICSERLEEGVAFEVANNVELPYEARSKTLVISFRLLTHCERWPELIAELCRVADQRVVVDYPARLSVNMVADLFFGMKKGVEKNTRTYRTFSHKELAAEFGRHGFGQLKRHPQFFFPMVLHRMLKNRKLSAALENLARFFLLTRFFGSPVVLEATRSK